MSQDQLFNKNSEHETEYESEYESEYEDTDNGTEYESSESDSDYDDEHNAKRQKFDDSSESEVLLTDETGHIQWYPGQVLREFEIKSVLGEGAFGRVLRVESMNTGLQSALKVMKSDPTKRKAAMTELIALTMITCRDPSETSFCMKMDNWFSYAGHVCIAFPLVGGSVFDHLRDNDFEPFTIDEVRHISYQLCTAVAFLHKNGMTHTDLKPENILFVDSSYTTVFNEAKKSKVRRLHRTDILLSDFGGVTLDNEYHQPIISTRYYRAPEVIMRLDWTNSCDAWSVGCILIELYIGDLLFPTHEDREHLGMMEKILGDIPTQMVNATKTSFFKNGKLDWNFSAAGKSVEEHCRPLNEFRLADNDENNKLFDLIGQMLKYEQDRRITFSDALVHPFFGKLSSNQRITNKVKK